MLELSAIHDGIIHLNVYSKAQTELGRTLSNFAHTPFKVPGHEAFESIEGYWYWLGCYDDRLRYVHGYEAKRLGRELRAPDWNMSIEFKDHIRVAIRAKLKCLPATCEAIKTCLLPLVHYYVNRRGGIKDLTEETRWILDVYEEYRDVHPVWSPERVSEERRVAVPSYPGNLLLG